MLNKNRYRICVITPEGYLHSACFIEVALLLKHSFGSLDFDCDITINNPATDKINVILGGHLLTPQFFSYEFPYIYFQLEQLSDHEGWYSEQMLNLLSNANDVWDYSKTNIEFLKTKGINAKLLPLGYHPALEIIPLHQQKNIDILFYGSLNQRRLDIINEINKNPDFKCQSVFGVYGAQLYNLIARSRLILNIHFYNKSIFEAVRISFLLNNQCFVISETSPAYPYENVELPLITYDKIIDTCYLYLKQPEEIIYNGNLYYKQFKQFYPMEKLLAQVI
jgi:hypothetical protein